MVKKIVLILLSILAVTGLTACSSLDVIGDRSIKSFGAVIEAAGDKVTESADHNSWSLEAPDGTASFLWSKDYGATTNYDVQILTDAQPFLEAGLDIQKLPEGMLVGNQLVVGTQLGKDSSADTGDVTPTASYEQLVRLYRNNLKYHAALDHFGINLNNGNAFEWAKDMTTNEKDIVYVLNPEVLINAGVNPNKVQGWVFAKVLTMDNHGKKIQADKFLKPFNLDELPIK